MSHLSAPREEKRRFLRRVRGFVVRLFKESWRLQFFNSLFFIFFFFFFFTPRNLIELSRRVEVNFVCWFVSLI